MSNTENGGWKPRSPDEVEKLLHDPRFSYIQPLCKPSGEPATHDDYRVIINDGPVMVVARQQEMQLKRFLARLEASGTITSLQIAPPRPCGID